MSSAPVEAGTSTIFSCLTKTFDKNSLRHSNRFGKLVDLSDVVNLAAHKALGETTL
jgi:hypothetical protein